MKNKNNENEVVDLRSAIELLARTENQLLSTDVSVDPFGELAGVYAKIGAGTPVKPPTQEGPAMIFNNVKGYDIPVITGVMASRKRMGLLLGVEPDRLGRHVLDSLQSPINSVTLDIPNPPCQEVVHKEGFDICKLLPVPTNTPEDAGAYYNLGLIRAEDPETGEANVTIHRMCAQGPDTLSVFFVPGRHIDIFRQKAEKMGKALPVSINIGLDPAVYLGSCFEPPTTPLGFDELGVAGALRKRPVELVPCLTVDAKAIAHAEIVIEGEILPNVRVAEDQHTGSGNAMPEFPGYMGKAVPQLPVIKIKAITHRVKPIFQTLVGPALEHCMLAGIPTEASILKMTEAAMPGKVLNVYSHPAGSGKYMAIIQFQKTVEFDEGKQRQAALCAFTAFPELKQVVLVDDDVDPFNSDDVLWAMTTRYQGDVDTVFIPGVRCHPLDPSQTPEFSRTIRSEGISCKTIFDCTVPFDIKDEFRRAPFMDCDISKFLSKKNNDG